MGENNLILQVDKQVRAQVRLKVIVQVNLSRITINYRLLRVHEVSATMNDLTAINMRQY